MSESFVDLSYRGLALGKRIKLTQVRAAAGFLELPTPMPVGTAIGIATEDGVLLEATVAEVREQVTGSDRGPGMVVKPKLDADAARTWWKQRVTVAEERPTPQADAAGKVTVTARREAVPAQLTDDGRNTAVMGVVDEGRSSVPDGRGAAPDDGRDSSPDIEITGRDSSPEITAEPTDPSLPRISAEMAVQNPIVDDGKRTMMMDAVDLAALGLDPASSSGSMPAVTDDENGNGNGDKPENKGKKKKRRR